MHNILMLSHQKYWRFLKTIFFHFFKRLFSVFEVKFVYLKMKKVLTEKTDD